MLSPIEQRIKEKIENIGTPLKEWDIKIYRGILTGYNEAFIIDEQIRNKLVDASPKNAEIIRPILAGRDIFKNYLEPKKWLITIPSGWTNKMRMDMNPELFFKSQYPHVYSHFIDSSTRNYKGKGLFQREDKGDYWWELRPCAYWDDFDLDKIVYSEIVRQPQFCIDTDGMIVNDTCFILTGNNLKYIIALLNSKPVSFLFKTFYAGGGLGEEGYRYKKIFLEKLPIPGLDKNKIIETAINEIYLRKKTNINTVELETRIDEYIYRLYGFTEDEIDHITYFN